MASMRKYEGLHVGAVQIDRMRYGLPNELIAVFLDSMRRSLNISLAEYEGRAEEEDGKQGEDDDDEQDEEITVVELAGSASVIADRLDTLGFTTAVTHRLLTAAFAEARESKASSFARVAAEHAMEADLVAEHDVEMARLEGYTSGQWIQDVRATAISGEQGSVLAAGSPAWLLDIAAGHADPRVTLRAALLAWPDAEVRLDITDDSYSESETVCSEALEMLRTTGAEHASVVVLTEGKTDVRVLESALQLLYPHLTDLIRFMDYGQKPMGGAGPLVNMVRAFAAAGISNRVIALFDYDTAASDALRNLDVMNLPPNIQVRQYPRLALAATYPTLGPPSAGEPGGRLDVADVNGLACSIELYLGRDLLSLPDGTLKPVQWHSYVSGMHQYQGEVVDKASLMDAYEEKVRAAKANTGLVATQDWTGLRAIIRLIMEASSRAGCVGTIHAPSPSAAACSWIGSGHDAVADLQRHRAVHDPGCHG